MFSIIELDKKRECRTLEHSKNIFHEALEIGEKYYHVHNPLGNYDISYKGNTEWFEGIIPSYVGKIAFEFEHYDEDDAESIDIDFLNAYDQYVCKELTEYSIAMAYVILKYTNKNVYFNDERILWFIEENERLHIGDTPENLDNTVYLVGALGRGFVRGEMMDEATSMKSDIIMFNSAFYLQGMLNGRKKSDMKYMDYPLSTSEMGIGGILINSSCYIEFAHQLGFEIAYNGDKIAKFRVENLRRFFNLDFRKEDCTKENTLFIDMPNILYTTWRFFNIPVIINKNIITDRFVKELDEYVDAVLEGKKALGVLIRGTDFKSTGLDGARSQASVEMMTPLIEKWMKEYNYNKIALATEDLDVLEEMRNKFGKDVVAIAQERHRVSEFQKGQIINELEKELYSEEEYDMRVIETNINYFYALYMLSRCNGFMCSGQNNGWDTVNALNGGKFENVYKFVPGQNPVE